MIWKQDTLSTQADIQSIHNYTVNYEESDDFRKLNKILH